MDGCSVDLEDDQSSSRVCIWSVCFLPACLLLFANLLSFSQNHKFNKTGWGERGASALETTDTSGHRHPQKSTPLPSCLHHSPDLRTHRHSQHVTSLPTMYTGREHHREAG